MERDSWYNQKGEYQVKSSVLRWSVVLVRDRDNSIARKKLENGYRLAFLSVFFWISQVTTPSRQQRLLIQSIQIIFLRQRTVCGMMENGPVGTL